MRAHAFTVGPHIAFGQGAYQPNNWQGRRLLGHEVVHALQQTATTGFVVQRAEKEEDEPAPLDIPWHGTFRESYIQYALTLGASPARAAQLADAMVAKHDGWVAGDRHFENDAEVAVYIESMDDQSFVLRYRLATLLRQQLGLSQHKLAAGARETTNRKRILEATDKQMGERATPVRGDWKLLQEPAVAQDYLSLLEHLLQRPISAQDSRAASDGLESAEVEGIIGDSPVRRALTNLYTQAVAEFRAAGGDSLAQLAPLVETLGQQFLRGNPNAVLNRLAVGVGRFEGEKMLGIVHRPSGLLYYDALGQPLEGLTGIGYRDDGFMAIAPSELAKDFGLRVDDPGLRFVLSKLRQTIVDPNLLVVQAAEVYFDNVELVNKEVQKGLSDEAIKTFEDSLPMFIGFLAGHGLSWMLLRMKHPLALAIGGILRGLLEAAGYLLSIQGSASAIGHMVEAGKELSRVVRNDKGELSQRSQQHLQRAAVPLRKIVIDVAMSAATLGLARLLKGGTRMRLSCSTCKLTFRLMNNDGTLTPEGILHLQSKYPKRFKGRSAENIQETFKRDPHGTLLEEVTLEEVRRTHKEREAARGAPDPSILVLERRALKTTLEAIEKRKPGTVRDKSILDQETYHFVQSDRALRAAARQLDRHPNLEVRRRWREWSWGHGVGGKAGTKPFFLAKGKVGRKMLDSIEVFFDRNLAIITDATHAVDSAFAPIHQFKTLFYRRVLERATTLKLGAMDIRAATTRLVGK